MKTSSTILGVADVLDDPHAITSKQWGSLVGLSGEVALKIDSARLSVLSRENRCRHIEMSEDLYTKNRVIGVLMAMLRNNIASDRVWRLCWVEEYLHVLSKHDYQNRIPRRECVIGMGRGRDDIWKYGTDSFGNSIESAMRFALHGVIDDVPFDIRQALGCGWSLAVLGDEGFSGPQCELEAEKFAARMLQHYLSATQDSGLTEMVWRPMLECILINLVLRHTRDYHSIFDLPLFDRIVMRQVDMGTYTQLYTSAYYGGYQHAPNLDEWCVGMGMLHDMWQLEHDERKPDDNLNICSMLLRSGVSVRQLADYITYMLCSTEVPGDLMRVVGVFAVGTITSTRYMVSVPNGLAKRTITWRPESVIAVRKILAHSNDNTLASIDPALGQCELNLAEMRAAMDPNNNASYVACTLNNDAAVRSFREWVNTYDVVPVILAKSKYA